MRNKIFVILPVIFLILGALGYFYYQKNVYSKEILKLEIIGPGSVDLAEEVEYVVKYKNNGDTRLESPELVFEYPQHSLPVGEDSLRVTKGEEHLGDAIYPGEEKTITFKARLFGKEGEILTAKASMQYRPKNLKPFYENSTSFTTSIGKVPLSFELDLPSKTESAKEVQFGINYFSNLSYPLSDLRVKMDYPSDFEFIESSPEGLAKNEWAISSLNKAEGGRIEVKGSLIGEINETKIFQAKLGLWQNNEFVLLKEISRSVEISVPSLYISQQINGNPEYIASPGDILHYEIFFKNIGEEDLNGLFLIARLEGPFDFLTLKSSTGEFETGDNSIVFDWRRNPDLQILKSQQEGKAEFWVNLKEDWDTGAGNPKAVNKVYLGQTRKDFETKVNSKLVFDGDLYFNDDSEYFKGEPKPEGEEIFGNSGAIPPRIGSATTYTAVWRVENRFNPAEGIKVRAVLSENVRLTGKIFPEEQMSNFTFDSKSKEIVWAAGDIDKGQNSPSIAFQVAFTPDDSQKGDVPPIFESIIVSGEDQWTGQSLQTEIPDITTSSLGDEGFDGGSGEVRN